MEKLPFIVSEYLYFSGKGWFWIINLLSAFRKCVVTFNLNHGQGKDSYQHRRHWPRRLRQVHHHWSLDLPVRRYRQEDHREVRERVFRVWQGVLQVCLGAWQAEGWAWERWDYIHFDIEMMSNARLPLLRTHFTLLWTSCFWLITSHTRCR